MHACSIPPSTRGLPFIPFTYFNTPFSALYPPPFTLPNPQPANTHTHTHQLWACVTLFMSVNLFKTLIAKLLSSKFVRESHLQKMQDSIKKVRMRLLARVGKDAGPASLQDGCQPPAPSRTRRST